MIRLLSDYWFRNKLVKVWKDREKSLRDEYAYKESILIADMDKNYLELKKRLVDNQHDLNYQIEKLDREKRDLADIEKRVIDRKEELASVNHQLKEQIRILEAKARPDKIWETAFHSGFSKAWDMMVPTMTQGLDKMKEKIRDREIESSLSRLNQMVEERLTELKLLHLKDINFIFSKKKEFQIRLSRVQNQEDSIKYNHYIQAFDFMLERNGN